ncbi:hypothetical protein RIF29_04903 [Crotalaria pallida]|uniref:Uncharacterized protein n=1 Tax=Crotalaria pallida TaxID=3830 RepID=A0AAN9J2G6_CROPI
MEVGEGSGVEIVANEIPQNVESDFGPWMVVQRPQRRKARNSKGGENPAIPDKDSNMFHALQNANQDMVENLNLPRVEKAPTPVEKHARKNYRPNVQKSTKYGPIKPKKNIYMPVAIQPQPQPKVTSSAGPQKNFVQTDQVDMVKAKPR